jgi:hypothetical protein
MIKNSDYYRFHWYHPLNFRRKELEKLSKPDTNDPFKADYTEKLDTRQHSVLSD